MLQRVYLRDVEGVPARCGGCTCKTRLQITITVNMRTHKMEKNVYKKKLFSIYTVYYVY